MKLPLLASDRVLLLLSIVPYLREHGPTPVAELARTFQVDQPLLRSLITFLGTAGIPGETLAYQHNDLFDIDWDAFEESDIVSLTQTVAIDEAPRFTGTETSALLAGLHALGPLLSIEDSALAEQLTKRLSEAMGSGDIPAVSVTASDTDPRLVTLITAIEQAVSLSFTYRSASGTDSNPTVHPTSLTEREGIWYLRGFAVERGAERTFNVNLMSSIEVLGPYEPIHTITAETVETEERAEIQALVPLHLLARIRGFAPEPVNAPGTPEGYERVRIDAWHAGAAVRLAQHGPGEIEILSPPAARAAVSEWVDLALDAYFVDEQPDSGKRIN
ncbi:MAG: helix-turn-helix transcriptional regulator [Leucobacter sp.]